MTLQRVLIEGLVLVDRAEIEPGPGLTAVTGETGAGKTLFATALGLLFGADAAAGMVAAGADHAYVEGSFVVEPSFWTDPDMAALAALRPDPDAELVLARRVTPDGRTRALAWGRAVTKADLAAAGTVLLTVAGQHAQRRLVDPAFQRQLVDATGAPAHAAALERMAQAWTELEAARARAQQVRADAEAAATHADEVRAALADLDAMEPSLAEEMELARMRGIAQHRARLQDALVAAHEALASSQGAVDALGSAYGALAGASDIDVEVDELAARCLSAQDASSELAADLRGRLELLTEDPGLDAASIEARLGEYDRVRRHYGGTVEAVVARWEQLQVQAELIEDSGAVVAAADAAAETALAAATAAAAEVSTGRQAIAVDLAAAVQTELADLAMADSRFHVHVEPGPLGPSGADVVELRIAPRADVASRPIGRVASGGELSRIALALHVASGVHEAGTIVFDEIDAGIGGHTAHAVAAKLEQIAAEAQVLCITHLPQVAARAKTHVVVSKSEGVTDLGTLHGEDAVLAELARMAGSDPSEPGALDQARALRRRRFVQDSAGPGTEPTGVGGGSQLFDPAT